MCFICKEKGHWKSGNPDKKDKGERKPKEKKDDDSDEGAYAIGCISNFWFNDSGANGHYCGRLECFFYYEKY